MIVDVNVCDKLRDEEFINGSRENLLLLELTKQLISPLGLAGKSLVIKLKPGCLSEFMKS